jgi:DNA-binding transcriptional LysR family regulator
VDLDLIRSFVAVADTGVITDAAKTLMVSQSTLSRRVLQLERQLDAVLVLRGSRGVELTEAGRTVLAAGRELIAGHDRLQQTLRDHDQLVRGSLRIGGGATATSFLLPACIASFRAAHPGVRFYVRESGSRQVAEDVATGGLDLAVVTLPIDSDLVRTEPLLVDEIVLVAPVDHPLTTRPARRHDLDGLEVIGFESGSAVRAHIDAALTTAGLRLEVVAELRSIPTMLNLVNQLGVPAFVSRAGLASTTEVSVVDTHDLRITRDLAIATRANVVPTAAATAFHDALRAHVATLSRSM